MTRLEMVLSGLVIVLLFSSGAVSAIWRFLIKPIVRLFGALPVFSSIVAFLESIPFVPLPHFMVRILRTIISGVITLFAAVSGYYRGYNRGYDDAMNNKGKSWLASIWSWWGEKYFYTSQEM